MEDDMKFTGSEDNLEIENEFLKMKMMLERGAKFGPSKDLPPEVENQFLKSVMEYEKAFDAGERIKVFEKLGRPTHFKPLTEISDQEMEREWEALFEFMQQRGIELNVCSPNITARELYRFTLEELFEVETDKVDLPGLMTCFIYDEFHPDLKYENSRVAVEECIHYFFEKDAFFDHHFANRVRVNAHHNLSKSELKYVVQKFKHDYDQIVPIDVKVKECEILGQRSLVRGCYEAAFIIRGKSELKRGEWEVGYELDPKHDYWYINNVQIQGIKV